MQQTVSDRRGGVTDAVAIAPELHVSRGNSVLRSSIDLGRSLDLDVLVVFALDSCSRACLCEMRWVHLILVFVLRREVPAGETRDLDRHIKRVYNDFRGAA